LRRRAPRAAAVPLRGADLLLLRGAPRRPRARGARSAARAPDARRSRGLLPGVRAVAPEPGLHLDARRTAGPVRPAGSHGRPAGGPARARRGRPHVRRAGRPGPQPVPRRVHLRGAGLSRGLLPLREAQPDARHLRIPPHAAASRDAPAPTARDNGRRRRDQRTPRLLAAARPADARGPRRRVPRRGVDRPVPGPLERAGGEAVKARAGVMDRVTAYRLWQAPFAEKKLEPVMRHNDFASMRRVLDVGCGPGTNARHFLDTDYLGVDMNPDYIAWARRRFGDRFAVQDVTRMAAPPGGSFDAILVNSLLHHIDDPNSRRILSQLSQLLTLDEHV